MEESCFAHTQYTERRTLYCYSKTLMYVAGFVVTESIRFRHVYVATVDSRGPKLQYRIYYIYSEFT